MTGDPDGDEGSNMDDVAGVKGSGLAVGTRGVLVVDVDVGSAAKRDSESSAVTPSTACEGVGLPGTFLPFFRCFSIPACRCISFLLA